MPRFALAGAILVMSSLSMRAAPDTVTVDGGRIAGAVDRGVRVFKGIPYAAPPVGPLRWRPPQPVVAWSGVRDASAFGAECPQTQYPAGSVYIRPIQKQSEDCLFLNVWTTAKPGDRQPVLVSRNDEPYLEFGNTITVGHHLLKRELDYQERVRSGS